MLKEAAEREFQWTWLHGSRCESLTWIPTAADDPTADDPTAGTVADDPTADDPTAADDPDDPTAADDPDDPTAADDDTSVPYDMVAPTPYEMVTS